MTRVEAFCDRLDKELQSYPSPEDRRSYLQGKAAWWERARIEFFQTIDADNLDEPPDGPDAYDYVAIIGEIYKRMARVS